MEEELISNDPGVSGLIKEKTSKILFDLVTAIPESLVSPTENPEIKIKTLIKKASVKTGVLSATLAIPAGSVGVLTIIPDLTAIWRIQAQLVADIAASYGQIAVLSREAMVWCLFRHTASQLVRDVAVRTGSRIIMQKVSVSALRALLQKIGIQASSKLLGRALFRAIPALGAIGSGAYAYYDTQEVGKIAQAYFKGLADQNKIQKEKTPD
jgi:hypothetical protein